MWRTIPSMILLSNACSAQSLTPIVPPPAVTAQSSPDNAGQIISFGVEFGLPYDLTTALENPLGRALTAISVAAGGLIFGAVSVYGSQSFNDVEIVTATFQYSGSCFSGEPSLADQTTYHHWKKVCFNSINLSIL